MTRWLALSAVALTASMAWVSTDAVPAHAQVCSTSNVISVQRGFVGFNTTILDSWAYTIPMTAVPTRIVTVNQVVTCPSVVFTPAFPVFPMVFQTFPVFTTITDPPAPGAPSGSLVAPPQTSPQAPLGPPGVAPRDTLRDLAQHPNRFDRQVVSLTGTVGALAEHRTARGESYSTFELRDGGASLLVLVWGRTAIPADTAVRVTGAFYALPPFALATGEGVRPVLEAQLITAAGGR
jgi:hypothetical protein